MTQTVELPAFRFVHGAASGTRAVLPGNDGRLPEFVAVCEPVADYPHAFPPADRSPLTHIYQRSEVPLPRGTVYMYVRSLRPAEQPRIVCPDCGMPTANPGDIEHGYCGNCHNTTQTIRYAVLRGDGVPLPGLWEGQWHTRRADMVLSGGGRDWTATPTGRFERDHAGRYAEVYIVRPAG